MQKLAAVDREKPVPLTTQVVGAVLSAVPPGASEVLPSRKDLAEQLGVGLTTLNQAVTRLKVGGYAFEAVGVGTVVRRPANRRRPHAPATAPLLRGPRHGTPPLSGADKAICQVVAAANEVGGRDALRLAYWFSHYELGFSYQTIGAVPGRDQTTIWELAHACAAAMTTGPALAKRARKIARSLSPEVQRRGARAGWRAKAGLGAALS
jgi:hypothetical protein